MSLNTRDKDGGIADYLEARRPFGTAQWNEFLPLFIAHCKTFDYKPAS